MDLVSWKLKHLSFIMKLVVPRLVHSSPTTMPKTLILVLRIATELHLKRLIVGGMERVYEMAVSSVMKEST